jgi:hypothetical protein
LCVSRAHGWSITSVFIVLIAKMIHSGAVGKQHEFPISSSVSAVVPQAFRDDLPRQSTPSVWSGNTVGRSKYTGCSVVGCSVVGRQCDCCVLINF